MDGLRDLLGQGQGNARYLQNIQTRSRMAAVGDVGPSVTATVRMRRSGYEEATVRVTPHCKIASQRLYALDI